MRVERADVDAVKNKLESLKRKTVSAAAPKTAAIDDYEDRLNKQILEKEAAKKRRKEEEVAKKQEAAAKKASADDEEEEEVDPDVSAMMGFKGFGSSKR
jgi:U4/U6.U5 tri-snRNP component SNU23